MDDSATNEKVRMKKLIEKTYGIGHLLEDGTGKLS